MLRVHRICNKFIFKADEKFYMFHGKSITSFQWVLKTQLTSAGERNKKPHHILEPELQHHLPREFNVKLSVLNFIIKLSTLF